MMAEADIARDVTVDLADKDQGPVVVNVENGGHAVVNVNVKNFTYPEWLDNEVKKRFAWKDEP